MGNTHTEYEAEQIKKTILGGFIDQVVVSKDKESFGFMVSKGNERFTVWVDQDPEGNGPGHLNIEEAPKPVKKHGTPKNKDR